MYSSFGRIAELGLSDRRTDYSIARQYADEDVRSNFSRSVAPAAGQMSPIY